jgi:hypothetical protein
MIRGIYISAGNDRSVGVDQLQLTINNIPEIKSKTFLFVEPYSCNVLLIRI